MFQFWYNSDASLYSNKEDELKKLNMINDFAEQLKEINNIKKDRKKTFGVLLRILTTSIYLRKNKEILTEPRNVKELIKYRKFFDWLREQTKKEIFENNLISTETIEGLMYSILDWIRDIENTYSTKLVKSHYYIEYITIGTILIDTLLLYLDEKYETIINEEDFRKFFKELIIDGTLLQFESLEDISNIYREIELNPNISSVIKQIYKKLFELNNARDSLKYSVFTQKIQNIIELYNILLKEGIFYKYFENEFKKNDINENPFKNIEDYFKYIKEIITYEDLIDY